MSYNGEGEHKRLQISAAAAGTGWSASGPAAGKKRWPYPDGGRGSNRLTYEKPRVQSRSGDEGGVRVGLTRAA